MLAADPERECMTCTSAVWNLWSTTTACSTFLSYRSQHLLVWSKTRHMRKPLCTPASGRVWETLVYESLWDPYIGFCLWVIRCPLMGSFTSNGSREIAQYFPFYRRIIWSCWTAGRKKKYIAIDRLLFGNNNMVSCSFCDICKPGFATLQALEDCAVSA